MADKIRVVVSSLEAGRGAIKLRVAQPPPPEPGVKIKVEPKDVPIKLQIKEPIKVYLKVRSTLEGNYFIYDHPLYDIVIMPSKNKIVTFSRADAKVDPYPSQNKLFNFLRYKGIIAPDTIQGGNVYSSLEAIYPVNDKIDTLEVILLAIYDFLKEEVPEITDAIEFENAIEDHYTEPEEEDRTELGKVSHSTKKGTIDPQQRPYGLIYRI
jgi:hypothetical protein